MFEHHFLPDNDQSVTGLGEMVVQLGSLDEATLQALPGYLARSLDIRLGQPGCRPLLFKIGDVQLPERAIWTMLCALPGADDYVVEYVELALAKTGNDLPFYTGYDVLGQEPLYAFIDTYIRRETEAEEDRSVAISRVLTAFKRFVQACDMDHEVFQDDYLRVVIRSLYRDKKTEADFMVLRLTTGQHTDPDDYVLRRMRSGAMLKPVVDRMLLIPEISNFVCGAIRDVLLRVYGSDTYAIEQAWRYCSNRAIEVFPEFTVPRYAERHRLIGDSHKRSKYCNTGFHVYDVNSESWRWVLGVG